MANLYSELFSREFKSTPEITFNILTEEIKKGIEREGIDYILKLDIFTIRSLHELLIISGEEKYRKHLQCLEDLMVYLYSFDGNCPRCDGKPECYLCGGSGKVDFKTFLKYMTPELVDEITCITDFSNEDFILGLCDSVHERIKECH